MERQSFRLGIAALLSFTSIVGVIVLAVLQLPIPELLQLMVLSSVSFLFGVSSNGSGIPKPPTNGGPK